MGGGNEPYEVLASSGPRMAIRGRGARYYRTVRRDRSFGVDFVALVLNGFP